MYMHSISTVYVHVQYTLYVQYMYSVCTVQYKSYRDEEPEFWHCLT